jgi:hypothetical protein
MNTNLSRLSDDELHADMRTLRFLLSVPEHMRVAVINYAQDMLDGSITVDDNVALSKAVRIWQTEGATGLARR